MHITTNLGISVHNAAFENYKQAKTAKFAARQSAVPNDTVLRGYYASLDPAHRAEYGPPAFKNPIAGNPAAEADVENKFAPDEKDISFADDDAEDESKLRPSKQAEATYCICRSA